MKPTIFKPIFGLAVLASAVGSAYADIPAYSVSEFAATPPFLSTDVDPLVLINLSVELTQQAEAYTDGAQTYANGTVCPGRTDVEIPDEDDLDDYGVCYSGDETYIGYFDPDKCYEYMEASGDESNRKQKNTGPWQSGGNAPNVGYFKPASSANANHECSGKFSGNFMNWITMTALDEFRYAMTGGARLVDTSGANAKTLLTRTHRYGSWSFVGKAISENGIKSGSQTFTTDPSNVTPFDKDLIYVETTRGNTENRVVFREKDGDRIGTYNVIVEVCNEDAGLEANCVKYTDPDDATVSWYKPEGILQKNALKMRYALTSYTAQDTDDINGGVLRSNAKYIGYYKPAAEGGLEVNPVREINEDGTYRFNPDGVAVGDGVVNSGILNYINMFGIQRGRYKSNDPAAELYYEGLRYLMGLDPTPSFSANATITTSYKDGFPVLYDAESTNSQWSWNDPMLDACQSNYVLYVGDQFTHADSYLPGEGCSSEDGGECADISIDADTLTDTIGGFEGMGTLGDSTRPGGTGGYWIAGLSYWANTADIRPTDLAGDQRVKTFIVDTQEYNANPPTGKNNPLWLAAKYGGFETDGWTSGTAPTVEQWDTNGDGVPNTYTLASQPANLISGLQNAFSIMTAQINAGSAAGVTTNTSEGQGMVVQGLFKPNQVEGSQKLEWGGLLHSIFIDEFDNYREDANDDAKLDSGDPVISYEVSAGRDKATISRYTFQSRKRLATDVPYETGLDIDQLEPIWDAREQLAALDNTTEIKNQRAYSSSAAGGRYIFTAIDGHGGGVVDGVVSQSETFDFVAASFPKSEADSGNNNFRYLDIAKVEDDGDIANIVNYVRGFEDASLGFRSRTIDYDQDGADEVWRLGDIVSSSPVVVGAPGTDVRYDRMYGDKTYAEFYEKYENRRQMVYVGANDGMLHAFNAGFFDVAERAFKTSMDGETAHPLGSEMWAYVPYNLLPHLKWLASPDYPHVFYVDGIPQVFDVNIFNDDAEHPNGWGTILVVGLRFGGGDYDVQLPGSEGSTTTVTTRSSYVVLDITNPESPPTLVAEISHPKMGFTTGRPTIMKRRAISENAEGNATVTSNNWYLVFGSGPYGSDNSGRTAAMIDGVSDQSAKIFVFDLKNKVFTNSAPEKPYFEVPGSASGFVGDFTVADWNGDFTDDVAYFGVITGSVTDPGGDFMRFVPGSSFSMADASIRRVISKNNGTVDQPFSGKAFINRYKDESWVFIGAGRFFVSKDNLSAKQMSYYGIKEPVGLDGYPSLNSSISVANLLDVSDIDVEHIENAQDSAIYTDGGTVTIANEDVETFSELKATMDDYAGWIINFDDLKARNVGLSDGSEQDVVFTEYVGSGDACEPLGDTYLNRVFYKTGTAPPYSNLQVKENAINGKDIGSRSFLYNVGLVRDVVIIDKKIIGQGSLGNLPQAVEIEGPVPPPGRMSWREINVDW